MAKYDHLPVFKKSYDLLLAVYQSVSMFGKEYKYTIGENLKKLKPGMYETLFDGSSLNGGVYFYKISAGDFSETKRMLLIK